MTKEETKLLRSKFSTLEIKGQGKYSKYAPRVFTEQGLYMLATILKSKVATEISIAIMDTFVKMRHYINYNKNFYAGKELLDILKDIDKKIIIVSKNIDNKLKINMKNNIIMLSLYIMIHFTIDL